jgi:hypothetical protein
MLGQFASDTLMGHEVRSMNEQFQALTIDAANAGAAYPLVRLHDAGITLPGWLAFARRRYRAKSGRSGLVALRDCRGIVHAVFSYRTDVDLRARKRLCISHLIVAHLPGSGIDEAVAASARKIASTLGCSSITREQIFSPTGMSPRCPTAKLLRNWPRFPLSTRHH